MNAASHELRTPLNNILGLMNALRNEVQSLSPNGQTSMRRLSCSTADLNRILLDVVEVFQLTEGSIILEPELFELKSLLEEVVTIRRKKYEEAGYDLAIACNAKHELWVKADPVRVRQCIMTLLDQAAHQTKQGNITVEFVSTGSGDKEPAKVEVLVKDTCRGMDQSRARTYFAPELFDINPFLHGRPSAMISMNLAYGIAKLHGGTITAKSQIGAGVTFCFSVKTPVLTAKSSEVLAMKARTSADAYSGAPQNNIELVPNKNLLKGINILLVDDNEINLLVLETVLRELNFDKSVLATGGRDALAKLPQHRIDLIFMDIQMPDLDGIATTKAIREMGGKYKDVPIIAVSAGSRIVNETLCQQAGMDGYIEKPIKEEILFAAVRAVADRLKNKSLRNAA
ncbi:MAG: hypothetical protein DHS20C05_11800 [Hyphococcus sp.]|nr:MAG: hypothetical protein DHS20C05_11800 [Marinicaulis sp.]